MSDTTAMDTTYASGRYSKRKRTQVTYFMDEMDVSDSESEFEAVQAKKRKASSTPKRLPKSQIFPFMQLPAEIRNMIYSHALTDSNGINLVATFKHKRRITERVSPDALTKMGHSRRYWTSTTINDEIRTESEAAKPLCPALLAVNKQMHAECCDFLYANEFIFADTQALYNFLINLGPTGAKKLKSIRLTSWGHGRGKQAINHACFALLACATELETLYIDAIGRGRGAKGAAEQMYRDAFPWLEAFGAAKGKLDAAVDVLQPSLETLQYCGWRTSNQSNLSEEWRFEIYRETLRKILGAQRKRIMAKMIKKKKVAGGKVTDEL